MKRTFRFDRLLILLCGLALFGIFYGAGYLLTYSHAWVFHGGDHHYPNWLSAFINILAVLVILFSSTILAIIVNAIRNWFYPERDDKNGREVKK